MVIDRIAADGELSPLASRNEPLQRQYWRDESVALYPDLPPADPPVAQLLLGRAVARRIAFAVLVDLQSGVAGRWSCGVGPRQGGGGRHLAYSCASKRWHGPVAVLWLGRLFLALDQQHGSG